jgi:hypothetical protein
MLVCPDPSAFITYISELPSRSVMKAIFAPSGDQVGHPQPPSLSVSLVCPDPSASMTYTFLISLDAWQIEGIWS